MIRSSRITASNTPKCPCYCALSTAHRNCCAVAARDASVVLATLAPDELERLRDLLDVEDAIADLPMSSAG